MGVVPPPWPAHSVQEWKPWAPADASASSSHVQPIAARSAARRGLTLGCPKRSDGCKVEGTGTLGPDCFDGISPSVAHKTGACT